MNDSTINSIMTKLDLIIDAVKQNTPIDIRHNVELNERLSDADVRFTSALAMLVTIQNGFLETGSEITYFSIEGVRNEIKAAYQIMTAGTIYDGNLEDV
jgi:hypothetical protein